MSVQHWAHFHFNRGPVSLSWATFVSPLSLGALAVMGINDAWLRRDFPNFLTGKISDVAVLIFFPFFLMALLNGAKALIALIGGMKCVAVPTTRTLGVTIAFTALVFTLLQISPAFVNFYLEFLMEVNVFSWMKSFRYTPDLTDLFTLPTLIVTYLYGQHRIKRFALETSI